MSQLGMNLPGGARRRPQMTVYTGMLFIAVVSLATACAMVFLAGQKIGPGGDDRGMARRRARDRSGPARVA